MQASSTARVGKLSTEGMPPPRETSPGRPASFISSRIMDGRIAPVRRAGLKGKGGVIKRKRWALKRPIGRHHDPLWEGFP
jgi:hypothetical protein